MFGHVNAPYVLNWQRGEELIGGYQVNTGIVILISIPFNFFLILLQFCDFGIEYIDCHTRQDVVFFYSQT